MVTHLSKFCHLAGLMLLVFMAACSPAPTGQQPSALTGSSPNLATVFFYRTHSSPGAVVGVDLKDNGLDIGTLQDGTYFVYHASPGQHGIAATTDTTSTQNFQLQAGATYYIKATVVPTGKLYKASLNVVFDLQGQAAIQNLRRLHYQE
jgi:hypothetical protein